jgi:hypothetical protein
MIPYPSKRNLCPGWKPPWAKSKLNSTTKPPNTGTIYILVGKTRVISTTSSFTVISNTL